MAKYQIILAFDVPCYHRLEIEAENQEAAEAKADDILLDTDSGTFEPEWQLAEDYRVADVVELTTEE